MLISEDFISTSLGMVEKGGEERGKHKGHNYKNDSMLIWLTVANLYRTVFRAILVFFNTEPQYFTQNLYLYQPSSLSIH